MTGIIVIDVSVNFLRSNASPDCRDDTLKALQVAILLGMDRRMVIHTQLVWRDKAATGRLALALGGKSLEDSVNEHTHTCYLDDRTRRHARWRWLRDVPDVRPACGGMRAVSDACGVVASRTECDFRGSDRSISR